MAKESVRKRKKKIESPDIRVFFIERYVYGLLIRNLDNHYMI